MSTEPETANGAGAPEPTVERGTYEIIRDRLIEQGRALGQKAENLNKQRLELFGSTELTVLGSERIRTENNCVPRDIVNVGDYLLFGYNVFIGLKTETSVQDVFSLQRFEQTAEGFSFSPVPLEAPENFLNDPQFTKEFKELYQYYKGARLLQLRRTDGRLLAIFQIGATLTDIKVFRWAVDVDENVTYIDNRGERDHVFPPSHDFSWTPVGRDNFVSGKHPHASVLDEVFVDTVEGDLTIKIENNTEDGLGVWREPVDDPDQTLDDAQISFAKVGTVILLKILPYRERVVRYLVFNTRTKKVNRIDAIGQACVQLPEDHGIIFPGGYYLQSGETKSFDSDIEGMEFKRAVRSPNGEDVLYIFHRRDEGRSVLLPYNMIRKQVQTPIQCHGYSIYEDGKMVVFRAVSEEPTRVHTMQVWQTPFSSDAHAAQAPTTGTFLEKVGNAELVRGISDALSIRRMVEDQKPTVQIYEDLIKATISVSDNYYWLGNGEVGDLLSTLKDIQATAELIIDEFEKVQQLQKQARDSVDAEATELEALFRETKPDEWTTLDAYVESLSKLRQHRGKLISLKEIRYVDNARIAELERQTVLKIDLVGQHAIEFLLDEKALAPFYAKIEQLAGGIPNLARVADCAPVREVLDTTNDGLELLTEIVGGLKIDDATQRTRILENISEVLGNLNRVRAMLENRRRELLSHEGMAEFGARFKLFGQAVSSALNMAETPEKCEAQLSKMMLQLEELESRFSEFDEFLGQLSAKREEVYEAFSARRQALLDQRQRRAQHTLEAADRILQGVTRRSLTFTSVDELNAYFASDPMVMKVRDMAGQLRELGDSVKADELESRLKSTKTDGARALRDKQDIFEEGTSIIRFGKHRFSVNTQQLELTMLPRDGRMHLHLSGTDFFQPLDDAEFEKTKPYWDQTLVSETPDVYRSEYLAACMLADAEIGENGLTLGDLHRAMLDPKQMIETVRAYAQSRYDEGYERGIHDVDASVILERLLSLRSTADLLRYSPTARAAACLFWAFSTDQMKRAMWERRARSLGRLRQTFAHSTAITEFANELTTAIVELHQLYGLPLQDADARIAGEYLFEELIKDPVRFVTSGEAVALRDGFVAHLESAGRMRAFQDDLKELQDDLTNQFELAHAWLAGFLERPEGSAFDRYCLAEAVVLLITDRRIDRDMNSALTMVQIGGLLGQHPRIQSQVLNVRLDEFLARLGAFRHERVPGYRNYLEQRLAVLERERKRLRLSEFMPRVMSSFVRNRLIDEVYLALIGANLAKQMGSVGETKRTDLMGMLLLISPPGYGKTTLMEYIANRLGLVFMKVNGPALGHSVTSLDPAEAPNATARQEVEKTNLAFEMGNNVMLYIDDIQHTNPEFLQKFISLCDAQRKIEGVWNGQTRTYDFRGKRFCVCMAGNPYTESGEQFRIPDMLANRADTYNLGDILEGKEQLFALSYIENALTSNAVLSPLTTREPKDIPMLVRMAHGEAVPPDSLAHGYSSVELNEILSVMKKLLHVQRVLLSVNQQYILSASMGDAYRTEPPFKLQGSYRNMNKLAEKIVAVMNDQELEALIDDHYAGESQTLTTGAEQNLLKLAELRGRLSGEKLARWNEIKRTFQRVQSMGGSEDDPVTRVTGQIARVSERLEDLKDAISNSLMAAAEAAPPMPDTGHDLAPYLDKLEQVVTRMAERPSVDAHAPQALATLSSNFERLIWAIAERATEERAEVVVQQAPQAIVATAGPDLTPYLAQLNQTLVALAEAPRGGEFVQVLPAGVHDLISGMVQSIEDALLPVVRNLGQELQKSHPATDPKMEFLIDKTLKSLDQLKDLLDALRKIDTRSIASAVKPSRKKS